MNDQTIQMIAQAIIANTKVIQSLIDALPHETKAAVAAVAEVVKPAPVLDPVQSAPVVAPVVPTVATIPTAPAPAPVVVAPAAPVVASPSNAMPAPPTFTAPAPAAPAPTGVPFSDTKGLIGYVMDAYKAMGPQKGAQIQNVLTSLGYQNINDVTPEHFAALYAGVEQLKAS